MLTTLGDTTDPSGRWVINPSRATSSTDNVRKCARCAPLVIWLLQQRESAYAADSAKEALNFQIAALLYHVTFFTLLGFAFMLAMTLESAAVIPVIWTGLLVGSASSMAALVLVIIGSVKAYRGEEFRYPLTLRLIK